MFFTVIFQNIIYQQLQSSREFFLSSSPIQQFHAALTKITDQIHGGELLKACVKRLAFKIQHQPCPIPGSLTVLFQKNK